MLIMDDCLNLEKWLSYFLNICQRRVSSSTGSLVSFSSLVIKDLYLFLMECQFLLFLSNLDISAHFFPLLRTWLIRMQSSFSSHSYLDLVGSRWFSHLSLHCLGVLKQARSDQMYSSLASSLHLYFSPLRLRQTRITLPTQRKFHPLQVSISWHLYFPLKDSKPDTKTGFPACQERASKKIPNLETPASCKNYEILNLYGSQFEIAYKYPDENSKFVLPPIELGTGSLVLLESWQAIDYLVQTLLQISKALTGVIWLILNSLTPYFSSACGRKAQQSTFWIWLMRWLKSQQQEFYVILLKQLTDIYMLQVIKKYLYCKLDRIGQKKYINSLWGKASQVLSVEVFGGIQCINSQQSNKDLFSQTSYLLFSLPSLLKDFIVWCYQFIYTLTMNQSKSSQGHLFISLFHQNPNTDIYKEQVRKVTRGIQERTFWYFTEDDAEFLGNIYNRQIDGQILKNRIRQITDEKMNELMDEIMGGKIVKVREEEHDRLEVQLDVRDIYEILPQSNTRSDRGATKVKEINQDFKRFKQKMEEIKRYQEMKKVEKAALEQQFRKSLENEKRQQHRQQIKAKLEELKKTDQERQKSNEKFKEFFKEFKKAKPLHVLMEEQYKEKVQLPKIEESRKKLQMLTHRKKPTLQEINTHDRYYMQSKASRPEKIIQSQTIDVSFKSRFYLTEEQKMKERQEQQENGFIWDQLEKQKRYSQFVKDKIKPRVSKKLKQRLQDSLVKNYPHYEVPDRSKVIEVGKNYLEFMRNLEKNRRSATPSSKPAQQLKESRYINYLEELKAKSQHAHTSLDWQRDLRDRGTSKLQKRQRVLMKSKQLQQKAMRDEKFVSNYNFGRAEQIINKKKEIDETLLSSIKAKVAILKDSQER